MEKLIEKYRDIKLTYFPNEKGEDKFFVNCDGKPLGKIKNTKGSLMYLYTEITGVTKASVNTQRRVATNIIQSDPILKDQEHRVQGHSLNIARKVYDRGTKHLKVQVTKAITEKDCLHNKEEILPKIVEQKRQEREKEILLTAIPSLKQSQT